MAIEVRPWSAVRAFDRVVDTTVAGAPFTLAAIGGGVALTDTGEVVTYDPAAPVLVEAPPTYAEALLNLFAAFPDTEVIPHHATNQ